MKLTIQLQRQPSPAQADALRRTLEMANAACDSISQVAFSARHRVELGGVLARLSRSRDDYGLNPDWPIPTPDAKWGDLVWP